MSAQAAYWKKYIASTQLDLTIAAYTKVSPAWGDDDFAPDFNRLYFIMEGEGYLKLNGRTFYPKPGQLFLLPAGQIQSYGTTGPDTFGKYWCHFKAKIGDLPLFHLLDIPAFVETAEPERLRLQETFRQLIHWHGIDSLGSALRVNALLLELLAFYLDAAGAIRFRTGASASLDKINQVLRYIDEHLADHLSLEELSQVVHFHPNYFIRVFKNTTGVSPIQYVNRRRMEKAKQLLSFSQLNISEIAESLGMEMSYFSRMFKDHTGFSPSQFRELYPTPQP
ncbi:MULTISPECIES: AraC family transcriptional regulator [unclassified Paenibacillus]|uniref:helix-turn-helix domain-containing protein n=1 Tax=unclassified Paenibacillus TaxID=185978 RepID=UPI000931E6C3|nr:MULTISPECIES: AraC family transcriptional regulator [unclassified Paenibacillus]